MVPPLWGDEVEVKLISVERDGLGAPRLLVVGKAAEVAAAREVRGWKVSLTHTDTVAMAVVAAW